MPAEGKGYGDLEYDKGEDYTAHHDMPAQEISMVSENKK